MGECHTTQGKMGSVQRVAHRATNLGVFLAGLSCETENNSIIPHSRVDSTGILFCTRGPRK